ncbi:invasion associated locus B family protein [Roseobacter ponti]|uniref:Invasion associated locus B family protein n=1 Tax=Roseobacter ponti TaxID=1891787 RepID=A0A858SWI2_9RHOB|nr:invasion associated locus B family protein [Roseobacter ponti]QJF52003.1 hypothetical protein G3256_12930 [Roseobacter ponti]
MTSRTLKVLFSSLLFATPLHAQDTEWFVQCEDDICVSQVVASETGADDAVATVSFFSPTGDQTVSLAVVLPLGVALEPGAQIVAGETVQSLVFKVCLPNGCTAYAEITPALRTALEGAETLRVQFFAQSDLAARALELPTKGLSAVFDRMLQ